MPKRARTAKDIGALSRVSAAGVRTALDLAIEGHVYDLGLEINNRMPQGPRSWFTPFSMTLTATPEETASSFGSSFAAEMVAGSMHTSTHIDAFVHVQSYGRVYGGSEAIAIRDDRGFRRHGVETIPPIVTRGVVLDVADLHDVDVLEDGYAITIDDLARCLDEVELEISPGDAILVRTGKIAEFWSAPETFQASQPGVGVDAAEWLYEQGMAVLATDTAGTEPVPVPDPKRTTHRTMLVESGVHLIENVYLDELRQAAIHSGLFICLPLRITGATASWVRPIMVV